MRKNLKVMISGISDELWEKAVQQGYLPVLAIRSPKRFMQTPIHFPEISPRYKMSPKEYEEYLKINIIPWKIINSFDVLSHLSWATGIVIFTPKDDIYQEILGKFLSSTLENEIIWFSGD